jgi:hypothetical protein
MPTDKKPWIRPQLIILSRGTPEENVLQLCKEPSWKAGGPNTSNCKLPGGGVCSENAPS